MSASTSEKVGVVVIHGVGHTDVGWINGYLIPQMEKWAAFRSVDAVERSDTDTDLLLVLPAEDRNIVVALGQDEDFRNFCHATGMDPLIDDPAFKTRAARLAHRDHLIYQLGMVVSLLPAHQWLNELQAAKVPCNIAFDPRSEVYPVRDPESSDPTKTWDSYSRRLQLPDHDVTVTELHWADMSKVGTTAISRFSALLQLFMESPFVLGKAFLNGCSGGVYSVIRGLIEFANWVMHWPIAGMTIAIMVAQLFVLMSQLFELDNYLPETVAVGLLTTMVGGFYLFRKWAHRKIGLAYLSLAGVFYAGFYLGILGVAYFAAPGAAILQDVREYLITGITLLLVAWSIWTIVAVSAALLIAFVLLWRVLPFGAPDGKSRLALSRPAAALSLSMMLGMLWKAILALLSIMIINALVPDLKPKALSCPAGMTAESFALSSQISADCALSFIRAGLIDVNAINGLSILIVLVTAALIVVWRQVLQRMHAKEAQRGALTLPRLIASPAVIAAIFATAIFNGLVLYVIGFGSDGLSGAVRSWAPHNFEEYFTSGVIGIGVFLFLMLRVVERTDDIVHIGRDLVDHQYNPSPSVFDRLLENKADREKAARHPKRTKYRRRQRIQRRLEALIDDVILAQQADRLIFVGHSQGTVVMHDYLVNHDDLIDPLHRGETTLTTVKRIDALTLGSPLGHLYQHYFQDYDQDMKYRPDNQPLIYKVRSWTNMWRVDDPIGRDVTIFPNIVNIGLPPGGHVDYWREAQVCEKIWSLILGEDLSQSDRLGKGPAPVSPTSSQSPQMQPRQEPP